MDPWTRPGVAATMWPKWNWMMEKGKSLCTHPSFLVNHQDQRTLLQMIHGWYNTPLFSPPSCSALSTEIVWVNVKPLWTVLMSLGQKTCSSGCRIVWRNTPMCPSLNSVWTLLCGEVIFQEEPTSSQSLWTFKSQFTFLINHIAFTSLTEHFRLWFLRIYFP